MKKGHVKLPACVLSFDLLDVAFLMLQVWNLATGREYGARIADLVREWKTLWKKVQNPTQGHQWEVKHCVPSQPSQLKVCFRRRE